MTENSYLNPEYIKSMCTGAINDLTLDNTDLGEVETAIKNFMDNDELKGNAYSALKDSMNQYLTYITYLRDANDADIADYNSLSSAGISATSLLGFYFCILSIIPYMIHKIKRRNETNSIQTITS